MPSGTRRMGLMHLNGNLLCAIDVETTGDKPGEHDLVQICVLPLDYKLDPWKQFLPFYTLLKPKRPETYDEEKLRKKKLNGQYEAKIINKDRFCDAMINGIEAWRAADLFDEWFQKLGLGFEKRISVLAQNWPFDRGFLIDWLGPASFDYHFDARYRDTMVAALFENDKADFHTKELPYPKVNLTYLARVCNVPTIRRHDAIQDCVITTEVYKEIIKRG